MDYDINNLTQLGLDTQKGLEFTGGQDKYLSALQRFYRNHEKNSSKMMQYYTDRDYENYLITVHALKSNAKIIGAIALSIEFEKLENAARAGDIATIEAMTENTLASYAELVRGLEPIGNMGTVRAADEISADEARDVADKLLGALDDFDDDTSKELANKLSGYPFRPTWKEKLKEAIAFIDDFMYDEAGEIIRQIITTIE